MRVTMIVRQEIKNQTLREAVKSVQARGFWDEVPAVCSTGGASQVIMAQYLRLVEEAGEFQIAYADRADTGLQKAVDELADMAIVMAQLFDLVELPLYMMENREEAYGEGLVVQLSKLARALRQSDAIDLSATWLPLLSIFARIEGFAGRICPTDFNEAIIDKLARDSQRGTRHGAANTVAVSA